MPTQDSPVNRASDALRFASSLALAAQLIASGSSLPSSQDTDNLVYDLLEIITLVTAGGREAMEPIEQIDRIMQLGRRSTAEGSAS